MIYLFDYAEEYLLKDGGWKTNPAKDENCIGLSGFLAQQRWENESYAFSAGFVKCLELLRQSVIDLDKVCKYEQSFHEYEHLPEYERNCELVDLIRTFKLKKEQDGTGC